MTTTNVKTYENTNSQNNINSHTNSKTQTGKKTKIDTRLLTNIDTSLYEGQMTSFRNFFDKNNILGRDIEVTKFHIDYTKSKFPIRLLTILSDNQYDTSIILENLIDKLENGSIIFFRKWLDNLFDIKLSPRDAFTQFSNNSSNLVDFIEFPIYTNNTKAFIYRKKMNMYQGWSD